MVAKSVDVSKEEDNGEGGWVGDGYILGRGIVATLSLSTASVFLPVTHVLNTFVSFLRLL